MVGLLNLIFDCDLKLHFSTADWPLKRGIDSLCNHGR